MNMTETEKLLPEAYLTPDSGIFATQYDGRNPGYAEQQYRRGKEYADTNEVVGIACNGTWFAERPGSYTTSYERIGYHADTAALLRGLLAGRVRFVVNRYSPDGITRTVIKEAS